MRRRPGESLVIVYSMRCPQRCDFCCHAVEEYGTQALSRELVVDLIQQAREIGSFSLVGITGGEPFLFHDDLCWILERAQPLPFDVRVVTAAHWASSRAESLRLLVPLVELGLTQLSVSTDPSHQQFVPAAHAENALRAGLELGLVSEAVAVFREPGISLDDVISVPEGARRVVRFAAPIGRARSLGITPETYGLSPERFRPCGLVGTTYDVTVFPDGQVYPCCSGGYSRDAGLSFGDARNDRLHEILTRIREDEFVRLVRKVGLVALYDLAARQDPELLDLLPQREALVNTCQICVAICVDPELRKRLSPLVDYASRIAEVLDDLQSEAQRDTVVGVP